MSRETKEQYIQMILRNDCNNEGDTEYSSASKRLAELENEIVQIQCVIEELSTEKKAQNDEKVSIEEIIEKTSSEIEQVKNDVEKSTLEMKKELIFPKEIEEDLERMSCFNELALKKELLDNIENIEDILKKRVTKIERKNKEYNYIWNDPGVLSIRATIDEE